MLKSLSRRQLLARSVVGFAGVAASSRLVRAAEDGARRVNVHDPRLTGTVGRVVDPLFDPAGFLESFDTGTITRDARGRTVRSFEIRAVDREIEVAPGVFFPAWTYNGTVPGPTLRATEGDLVRVEFLNGGSHPHTMHFHGVHSANMDGVFEVVHPGERFVYEFEARPFGLHLYHCHAIPLKKHIAKGLYGAFVIDPREGRAPAREMVMIMNGFDTNFDGENEIYAVNSIPFAYRQNPIAVRAGELQRIYLVNALEFDLINSFHLHAQFFKLNRTGTSLSHHDFTDTIMMCQGERHILEFVYDEPGRYMFHAHQSEFAELGWMGLFKVTGSVTT